MDAVTYTNLLQEHRNRVYGRALYVLRDADDAADVTQEVFLRLWRTGADVDPDRVAAWLARVTQNLCLDQIRRRKVIRHHFGTADEAATHQLAAPADAQSDPEWWLRLSERQRLLLDAMAVLPVETRDVLIMHYFQGMKLHEIAQQLDKTISALKVQIHRARRTLRRVLESEAVWEPVARREIG